MATSHFVGPILFAIVALFCILLIPVASATSDCTYGYTGKNCTIGCSFVFIVLQNI